MTGRVGVKRTVAGEASAGLSAPVGLAAVVFSALYFVSDLIERAQGGFSTAQLARAVYALLMEPGSLVMERKMLLGIKQRAEKLAHQR
jgi:hypothetical protein